MRVAMVVMFNGYSTSAWVAQAVVIEALQYVLPIAVLRYKRWTASAIPSAMRRPNTLGYILQLYDTTSYTVVYCACL